MSKSRKSNESLFTGSRIFMLLFGLILGLGIAAGVAWFVTQVPMPFTDKFSRADPTKPLPDLPQAPDPNQALSGRTEPAGSTADSTAKPKAGTEPGGSLQDDIGALLTTLGAPTSGGAPSPAPAKPTAPPAAASPASPAPQASSTPAPATRSTPPPAANTAPATGSSNQTTYYLQAGAFKAETDAQAMQARVLMLGLQSNIQPVQVNGSTLYRVRVGPFKGIDAMNRSRATLSNAKIETSVVRP